MSITPYIVDGSRYVGRHSNLQCETASSLRKSIRLLSQFIYFCRARIGVWRIDALNDGVRVQHRARVSNCGVRAMRTNPPAVHDQRAAHERVLPSAWAPAVSLAAVAGQEPCPAEGTGIHVRSAARWPRGAPVFQRWSAIRSRQNRATLLPPASESGLHFPPRPELPGEIAIADRLESRPINLRVEMTKDYNKPPAKSGKSTFSSTSDRRLHHLSRKSLRLRVLQPVDGREAHVLGPEIEVPGNFLLRICRLKFCIVDSREAGKVAAVQCMQ